MVMMVFGFCLVGIIEMVWCWCGLNFLLIGLIVMMWFFLSVFVNWCSVSLMFLCIFVMLLEVLLMVVFRLFSMGSRCFVKFLIVNLCVFDMLFCVWWCMFLVLVFVCRKFFWSLVILVWVFVSVVLVVLVVGVVFCVVCFLLLMFLVDGVVGFFCVFFMLLKVD